jgi:FHA domain
MTLIGLDLTARRVRAVAGPPSLDSAPLALEGKSSELPLALSLEERIPLVGIAGTGLARCKPHLACLDFLPHLGSRREWVSPRHRLDATRAFALVCERLTKLFGKAQGVAAALPAYFTQEQTALVGQLAHKAKWPWLGSIAAPVAAAWAARGQLPWTGVALVVDVDGYALTWSAVAVSETTLHLLQCEPSPHLSLNAWLNRLIDGVANHCIRRTRRDPRESAEAEQGLYDQLGAALDAEKQGRVIELNIQTAQWFQNLLLQPGELAAFCAVQVRQSIAEMKAFAASVSNFGPIVALLATSEAARLPGLLPALNTHLQDLPAPPASDAELDFGESLMLHDGFAAVHVHVLSADALAKAAHQLAAAFQRGELPPGHVDNFTTRSAALAQDVGQGRLQFRGQEHILTAAAFVLGRDPACDLIFESELYPTVSARHCEIVFDRGVYVLRDRSRHGTLVNDQRVHDQIVLHSGDWIRLGPGGPLIHFLGQPSDQRRLMTTA